MKTILPLGALLAAMVHAQTTQGLIAGRVLDSVTGHPIVGAKIVYSNAVQALGGFVFASSDGYFNLPLLSPGAYRLGVSASGYQPLEAQRVELAVAGRLDFNFRLRPLADVWEAGQYRSVFFPDNDSILTFFGPDVDTSRQATFDSARGLQSALDSSISTVIDRQLIANLPLNGHDVYTLLATQAGVTADTTTARGLGLAISGQRPAASNFMLDGVENNNYLVTGPLQQIAPEAVEEYRISNNNYSAEYGRTSGYVANAVSKSGSERWHGMAYAYLQAGTLDANGFQQNANGIARAPLHDKEPGASVGGPLRQGSLYIAASFEVDRYASEDDPQTILIPTTAFLEQTAVGGSARRLLQQYPAPPVTDGSAPLAQYVVRPPQEVNRLLALPRVDYLRRDGKDRLMLRSQVARETQPDFGWTPYKDFVTPLDLDTFGVAGGWLRTAGPALTNEIRFGVATDEMHFNRPHPEVPILAAGDGTVLPGSPEPYSYRNHGRNVELVENLTWMRGRHVFKVGGGLLARQLTGYLTAGKDGYYGFASGLDFAQDQPLSFYAGLSRAQLPVRALPDYDREYSYRQYFLFAQDSFKVSPALALSFGVRYENFGAPVNTGPTKDMQVVLGTGASLPQRIQSASAVLPGPADERLYDPDNRDFSVRAGFSYALRGDFRTVLHGGYGMFSDRPFDNLWQTLQANNIVYGISTAGAGIPFVLPVSQAIASIPLQPYGPFPHLTLFQPGLRDARAQNGFLGIRQSVTEHLSLEMNLVRARGRELVTTDVVNRPLSIPLSQTPFTNPQGYLNPKLPMLAYRGNQGSSDYYGLQTVARYRYSRAQFQLSYTWSHTIDNQSDPLAGEFFDFSVTNVGAQPGSQVASFTRQFDSGADHANSDFDQRHNLVFFGVWELPDWKASRFFRNWTLGELGAIRSGFPYSPLVGSEFNPGSDYLMNNRPNLVDRGAAVIDQPGAGGRQILNPAAFALAGGSLGNIGRNAFRGPGLYNVDVSLSRKFAFRRLGEAGRVTVRADIFNLLNHSNLNNPDPLFAPGNQTFGLALFGRTGRDPGFPAVAPLNELPRRVELMLRLEF
jgi:hypothetical protein